MAALAPDELKRTDGDGGDCQYKKDHAELDRVAASHNDSPRRSSYRTVGRHRHLQENLDDTCGANEKAPDSHNPAHGTDYAALGGYKAA